MAPCHLPLGVFWVYLTRMRPSKGPSLCTVRGGSLAEEGDVWCLACYHINTILNGWMDAHSMTRTITWRCVHSFDIMLTVTARMILSHQDKRSINITNSYFKWRPYTLFCCSLKWHLICLIVFVSLSLCVPLENFVCRSLCGEERTS